MLFTATKGSKPLKNASMDVKNFLEFLAHSSRDVRGFSCYPGGTVILHSWRGYRRGRKDFPHLSEEAIYQNFSEFLIKANQEHFYKLYSRRDFLAGYISQILEEGTSISYLELDLSARKMNAYTTSGKAILFDPLLIDAYDFEHLYLWNATLSLPIGNKNALRRYVYR